MSEKHPNPDRLWRHRRWKSYIGMSFSAFCVLFGAGLALISQEVYESTSPLITVGFWGGLTPMAGYFGNCITETIRGIK